MADYDGEIRIKAIIDSHGGEKEILTLLERLKKSTRDYKNTLDEVNKVNLNNQKFDNANKSINNQIEKTKKLNTFQEESTRLLLRKNNYYIRQEKNLDRIIDKEAQINRLQKLRSNFEAGIPVTADQKYLKEAMDYTIQLATMSKGKKLPQSMIDEFNEQREQFNAITEKNVGLIDKKIKKLAIDIEYAKNRYKEFVNYVSQYSKRIANLPAQEEEKQAKEIAKQREAILKEQARVGREQIREAARTAREKAREQIRIEKEQAREQIRIAKERDAEIQRDEKERQLKQEYLRKAFGKITDIAGNTTKTLANTFFTPFKLGFKAIESPIKSVTSLIGGFFSRTLRLAGLALVFRTLSAGFNLFREYLFGALKTNSQFIKSLNEIRSNLLVAFYPIYQAILPALNALMQGLSKATSYLAQFISMLFGKSISSSQKGAQQLNNQIIALGQSSKSVKGNTAAVDKNAEAYDGLGDSIQKDNKQLASFDKMIHNSKKEIAAFDKLILFNQEKDKKAKTPKAPKAGKINTGDPFIPTTNFDSTYNNMVTIFDKIKDKIQPTLDALKGFGQAFHDTVVPFAQRAANDFYEDFFKPLAEDFVTKGAPRFLNITSNMLRGINWDAINESLDNLWKALKPFSEHIGDGLLDFYEKVLVPLGAWTMSKVVPTFLDILSNSIASIDGILQGAKPVLEWFYEKFIKPIGEFAGEKFLGFLQGVNDKLKAFSEDGEKTKQTGEWLAAMLIGIAGALGTIAAINITESAFAWIAALVAALDPAVLAVIGIGAGLGVLIKLLYEGDKAAEVTKKAMQNFYEDVGISEEEFSKMSLEDQNKIVKKWMDNNKLIKDDEAKKRAEFTETHVKEVQNAKERDKIMQDTRNKFAPNLNSMLRIFAEGLDWADRKIEECVDFAKNKVGDGFNWVITKGKELTSGLGNMIGSWWNMLGQGVENTKNWLVNMFIDIQNFIGRIGGKIGDIFHDGIRAGIKKILGWVRDRVNGFIDKINDLIDLIRNIPGAGWIPHVPNFYVPGLAQGAVLKGGNPMLAYLNDQPKGQVNIETPLNTMIDAFKTAMNENNTVSPNITIEAQGDLGSIVKMLNLKLKQENARLGTSLVSGDVWY